MHVSGLDIEDFLSNLRRTDMLVNSNYLKDLFSQMFLMSTYRCFDELAGQNKYV